MAEPASFPGATPAPASGPTPVPRGPVAAPSSRLVRSGAARNRVSNPAAEAAQQESEAAQAMRATMDRAAQMLHAGNPTNYRRYLEQTAADAGALAQAEGEARRAGMRWGPFDLSALDTDVRGLRAAPDAARDFLAMLGQMAGQIPVNSPSLAARHAPPQPRHDAGTLQAVREGAGLMPEIVVEATPTAAQRLRGLVSGAGEAAQGAGQFVSEQAAASQARHGGAPLPQALAQDVIGLAETMWREPARRSEANAQLRDRLRAEAERLGDPELARQADRAALEALIPWVLDYPGILTAPEFLAPGLTAKGVAAVRNAADPIADAVRAVRAGDVGVRTAPTRDVIDVAPVRAPEPQQAPAPQAQLNAGIPPGGDDNSPGLINRLIDRLRGRGEGQSSEIPAPQAPDGGAASGKRSRRATSQYAGSEQQAAEMAAVNRVADAVEQTGGTFGDGLRLVVARRDAGIDRNLPFFHVYRNDKRVGDVSIGALWNEVRLGPRLDPAHRNQNIGTQLYQYIERLNGAPLGRSDNLTEAGAGLWGRLDRLRDAQPNAGNAGGGLRTGPVDYPFDILRRAETEEFTSRPGGGSRPRQEVRVHDETGEHPVDAALRAMGEEIDTPYARLSPAEQRRRSIAVMPRTSVRPGSNRLSGLNRIGERAPGRESIYGWGRDEYGQPLYQLDISPDGRMSFTTDEPLETGNVSEVREFYEHALAAIADDARAVGRPQYSLPTNRDAGDGHRLRRGRFYEAILRRAQQSGDLPAGYSIDLSGPEPRLVRGGISPALPNAGNNPLRGGTPEAMQRASPARSGESDLLAAGIPTGADDGPGLINQLVDFLRGRRPARVARPSEQAQADEYFAPTGFDGQRFIYNDPPGPARRMGPDLAHVNNPRPYETLGHDSFSDRLTGQINRENAPDVAGYDRALARQQGEGAGPAPSGNTGWAEAFEQEYGRAPESGDELQEFYLRMQAARRIRDTDQAGNVRAPLRTREDTPEPHRQQAAIERAFAPREQPSLADQAANFIRSLFQDEGGGGSLNAGVNPVRAPREAAPDAPRTINHNGQTLPVHEAKRAGRYPAINVETLRALAADRLSPADMSRMLNVAENTIYAVAKRNGIDLSPGTGHMGQRAPDRDARILAAVREAQGAGPNAGGRERRDNSYRAIAERLRAEGMSDVTTSVISGVMARNRNAATPPAAASATPARADDYFAELGRRLSISPERARALSARRTTTGAGPVPDRPDASFGKQVNEQPAARGANQPRTPAEVVQNLPASPDEWRTILNAHPWINTPARAQAIIMATARSPDGAMRYTPADIANATGYSETSLQPLLNGARRAGLPVPARGHSRGGAVARPGGELAYRIVELMERSASAGRPITGAQIAERLGTTPASVKVTLNHVRSGQRANPELQERLRAVQRLRAGGQTNAGIDLTAILPWLATGGYFTGLNLATEQGKRATQAQPAAN